MTAMKVCRYKRPGSLRGNFSITKFTIVKSCFKGPSDKDTTSVHAIFIYKNTETQKIFTSGF